jgi:hypothetical protein
MGASVEGEMHLVIYAILSYPIQCLLFLALFLFIFLFYVSREELMDTVLAWEPEVTSLPTRISQR